MWNDFITMSAISLSNPFELNPERKAKREKEYAECIKRLGGIERPAELLKTVVMAFELNPNQDFLGNLFMKIGLNNHWRGQFFTPYHVCEMMAQITLSRADKEIASKGYVSVFDCACGAGAILIAAAMDALYQAWLKEDSTELDLLRSCTEAYCHSELSSQQSQTDAPNLYSDAKFELIEVCEQTALFSDDQISDDDIPDGMYHYDLR